MMAEFIRVAKDLEVKEISKGVELPNVEKIISEKTIAEDEDKETEEDEQKQYQRIISDRDNLGAKYQVMPSLLSVQNVEKSLLQNLSY